MVGIDEDNSVGCNIQIKVNGILRKFTNDPDFDLKIEMLDYGDGDSDMEELFNEQANEEPEIETTSILNKPPLGLQLTKRPRRRKKVLSKITPFPCEHCGKTLIGRGNLVAHIKRIHLKQRDHKCKICQKAFNTSSALESHVLAVHTRRCENCQEYVIETEPWTEGMTMKTRRQVACECGELVDVICLFGRRKVYEDDDEELREKKRNYDPTKYACQHCGKLFSSRSHCLRHARKHTGSKDIHCQYCQESFRYENSLKKHLKSEHRIFQTHYCNICKVEFDSAVELETHKKHFHGLKSSESRKLKTGPAESKLVKCTTKVITALPTVKTVPVPAENRTSSASSSHHQESSSDIGTSLQKMLGTSQSPGDTEVAMRTVGGHVLDKDTYDLVQQALQGDQIFSQDGNTIIIRTVDVVISEETDKIYVELDMEMIDEIKVEEMDDSDMEYLDVPYVDNDENDEDSFIQEDSDIDPDFNPENDLEEEDADAGQVKKRRGRPRSKNPKKKRPLAEMRPRKCHHCSAVLTGISSLNSHIKRVHLKEKKYPCHICGYAFFTTTHREDHVISVHTRKCGKCNKDVIETTPWTEGMEKTNIRMVDCSCGNSVSIFSKVGRVRGFREEEDGTKPKRKRAASEITPIDCEHCGLTLTGRSSLYSHIRRQHLKTRNFKCTVCGKEFYTSTHLQCHILSVHTRKCQNCQEFVMETEPWSESMDKKQMRKVTCKCGTEVTIFTKLGPKHRTEGSTPKRNRSGESADTRYVCGTCGKIFLKKSNAMSHTCVEKEDVKPSTTEQTYANETDLTNETDESQIEDVRKTSQLVLEPDTVQYKMEGGNLVIAEGSQIVTFEGEEGQSISDVAGIQIMHDGKLVPAEHMVDEHGNVSFIIKQIE